MSVEIVSSTSHDWAPLGPHAGRRPGYVLSDNEKRQLLTGQLLKVTGSSFDKGTARSVWAAVTRFAATCGLKAARRHSTEDESTYTLIRLVHADQTPVLFSDDSV